MSIFPVHPNPHHVKHPTIGWVKRTHLTQADLQVLNAELDEKFIGGEPNKEGLYHIEIDCITGMQGWTKT